MSDALSVSPSRRWLLASWLVLLFVVPHAAEAAPADKAGALALWRTISDAQRVPAGWTGATESCTVGTESGASIEATLTTVNALRAFAGVRPVGFDAEKNRQALAAALMMAAAGRLSHAPDPGWPCYTPEGSEGAQSSNLYEGRSGGAAMVGYVEDKGVDSLGHRAWLLSPFASTFGTGSTGRTNALHVVHDSRSSEPVPPVTTWPSGGFMPWDLVFEDWSAQFNGPVDTSAARVSVQVDGVPRAVSAVRTLSSGETSMIAWNVATTDADRDGDHTVDVTIEGVSSGGVETRVSYRVNAVDVQPPRIEGVQLRSNGRPRPGRTLSVSAGVEHADAVTYQWLRNGRTIPGATSRTYRVRRTDRGRLIRCRVTAVNELGVTATRSASSVRIRSR